MRILVVAQRASGSEIARTLEREGHAVVSAESEASAARLLKTESPELMVLHAHSLSTTGAGRLKRLASRRTVPVLEMESHDPRVWGTGLQPLVDRVQECAARTADEPPEDQVIAVGELMIDVRAHTACVGDSRLNFTATEFELLCILARHPGWVWTREQLLEEIWGYDMGDTKVVTVHVGNLRKKLARLSVEDLVETVRGVGYRLRVADSPVEPRSRDRRTPPLPQGPGGAFVGRKQELRTLQEKLDAILGGRGTAVALAGEAGIGKTRLAEEFSSVAAERGAQVYWGRCYEYLGQPPYGPWIEAFKACTGESSVTGAAVNVPDLAGIIARSSDGRTVPSATSGHAELQAAEDRLQLFEELTSFVRSLAQERPLVLVLEDLHWSDASSVLLLHYAVQRLHPDPILVLATYRDTDAARAPMLAEAVSEILRVGGEVLLLDPLSTVDVRSLIEAAIGQPVTEALAANVFRRTDGNPLYVTELVRLLRLRDDPTAAPTDDLGLASHEGVRRVIGARLRRISPECRNWLEIASVIGHEFQVVLAGAAAGREPHDAARLVDEAERAHFIVQQPGVGSYRFNHALVREVLYGDLTSGRRSVLHGEIGTAVERLHPTELDRRAAELAHHFVQAAAVGYCEKAFDYSMRAADIAGGQRSVEEACAWLEQALQLHSLLPNGSAAKDPAVLVALQEDLGEAYWLCGIPDRATRSYQQAAELVPLEESIRRGRVFRKLSSALFDQVLLPDAETAILQAEAALGHPQEERERAWWEEWIWVRLQHAWLSIFMRQADAAQYICDGLAPWIERHGNAEQHGWLLECGFLGLCVRRRFMAGEEVVERARASADAYRAGDRQHTTILAELALGFADLWNPDGRGDARPRLQEAHRMSEDMGFLMLELDALWGLGMWHRLNGETEAVSSLARRTLELDASRHLGLFTQYTPCAQGNLAWVAWRGGDAVEAFQNATAAVETFERAAVVSPFEWQARWPLVAAALDAADGDQAMRQVEAMLSPLQAAMPAELEAAMRRFVEAGAAAESPPSRQAAAEMLGLAESRGYL